jgi:hypothetical protein
VFDITSLERRWLKYKIKQFIPYITIVLLVILVPIITLLYFNTLNKPIPQQRKKINSNNSVQPIKSIEDPQMILEPSMQFVQTFPLILSSTDSIAAQQTIKAAPKAAITQKQEEALLPPVPKIKETAPSAIIPSVKSVPSTNKVSTINRDTEVFDIHEIENRFKNNSNPHLGLYIARYHYDHGNYTESYNYALKTNAINNTIEESWLIFAKSLVKLGKTDQAKKTLQTYISESNSDNARNLLDSIGKGDTK